MTSNCGGANIFTEADFCRSNNYELFDRHRSNAAKQESGSDDLHIKTKGASLESEVEKRRVRERIDEIEDERRIRKGLELDFI